mmetsp:Transcript_3942/g.9915  ORF Transcript_3942/g.9915 Transcript_3942/m.9915 type:complete len:266 (-) Transcript_3942:45-842(-)
MRRFSAGGRTTPPSPRRTTTSGWCWTSSTALTSHRTQQCSSLVTTGGSSAKATSGPSTRSPSTPPAPRSSSERRGSSPLAHGRPRLSSYATSSQRWPRCRGCRCRPGSKEAASCRCFGTRQPRCGPRRRRSLRTAASRGPTPSTRRPSAKCAEVCRQPIFPTWDTRCGPLTGAGLASTSGTARRCGRSAMSLQPSCTRIRATRGPRSTLALRRSTWWIRTPTSPRRCDRCSAGGSQRRSGTVPRWRCCDATFREDDAHAVKWALR